MNLTLRVPLESFVKLFREMGVLEYKYFVKHSIQVANIAVEIADRLNLPFEKDGVYLSSLLHDVGLILKTSIANYELFVDMFGRISDMERIVLTLDKHDHHSVISWMALSQIQLCSDCSKSILYHHTPYQKINEKDSIVALSNCVKAADIISLKVLKYTGSDKELDADSIDEIISSIQEDQGIIDEVKKEAVDLLKDFTKHHLFLEEEPQENEFSFFHGCYGYGTQSSYQKDQRSETPENLLQTPFIAQSIDKVRIKTKLQKLFPWTHGNGF